MSFVCLLHQLLFGTGSFWGVAGSTSSTEVTYTCNGDAQGSGCVSGGNVKDDSYSGPGDNYDTAGAFSAYVNDHQCAQVRRTPAQHKRDSTLIARSTVPLRNPSHLRFACELGTTFQ